MVKLRAIVWCALALVPCACGGGGGGGAPPLPPAVTESYSFPAGDAIAVGGGTAWDIVGVTTKLSDQFHTANEYDTLEVDVTFAQDVANALPAPGGQLLSGNQLGVKIALDVDGNPNTGAYGVCDATNPLRPFEYVSDQGNDPSRLSDGNYNIIDSAGGPLSGGAPNPPAEAQTTVAGHVLSESFYLVALGVTDGAVVPRIGIAVLAYNGDIETFTDCVPKSAVEVFTT
jgi:hypothetical protein